MSAWGVRACSVVQGRLFVGRIVRNRSSLSFSVGNIGSCCTTELGITDVLWHPQNAMLAVNTKANTQCVVRLHCQRKVGRLSILGKCHAKNRGIQADGERSECVLIAGNAISRKTSQIGLVSVRRFG